MQKMHTFVAKLNWKAPKIEVDAYGQGGYHYNPHVSKPVALEPIGEEGGYHYFGPPPDFGASYGLYSEGDTTIIAPRSDAVYSPINGRPMKYVGPSTYDDAKKALTQSKFSGLLHSCATCGSAYTTSADSLSALSCYACGSTCEYASALMRGRRLHKK